MAALETPTRFAFYARVSTEDAQDPSLSIPRQLTTCEREASPVGHVVATYWDIESGRIDLSRRGNGADGKAFGVTTPREGGIVELLRDAARPDPPFDAVIVESIDRLSRMTADATAIERELEQRDIGLFAADEPMVTNATSILTRRVKQGVAEWYVRDLIEKSRRGMEESVRQGWHTGGPVPYGYMLEPHPHPNPHKAREGKKKHRLVPDPVRAPIALMIFEDYCVNLLGLGEICDKLNRDLERYPPPTRNRKDENDLPQTWCRSKLYSMLRNPKYTGYNVWNRHDKRRGRPHVRQRDQWVWSATAVHEAIVSRELFEAVEERARKNENHRRAQCEPVDYTQRTGRRNGRFYPLRGRVRCAMCGRRMEGSYQKGSKWYRCQYVLNRSPAAAVASGHPKTLGIKEDTVREAMLDFLAERIFGPDRLRLLRADLAQAASASWTDHDADRDRLKAELRDVDRALYRQTLRLEEHDEPDHPVVALATRRIEELTTRREAITEAMASLDGQQPDGPHPDEVVAMLDAVPDLRPELASASDERLADVLDAFDVSATYSKAERWIKLTATITAELMPSPERNRPPQGRSGNSDIAGERFGPISDRWIAVEVGVAWPQQARSTPRCASSSSSARACRCGRPSWPS